MSGNGNVVVGIGNGATGTQAFRYDAAIAVMTGLASLLAGRHERRLRASRATGCTPWAAAIRR